MTDADRHAWLKFMYYWLAGNHMNSDDSELLSKWQQIAQMFPPRAPSKVNLFRLVTLPISYAEKRQFTFKPAPGKVSSWTRTLTGLDAVAGVATDFAEKDGKEAVTARLAIEAIIPGNLVLATPVSIRNAFMTLSHDYFDRYKETPHEYVKNGTKYSGVKYPGYPGGEEDDFSMDDVGFLQDVLNRRGGHYRQYEVVVQTPPKVDAKVVQIYRVGSDTRRMGNDDPHQFSGRGLPIRRMKEGLKEVFGHPSSVDNERQEKLRAILQILDKNARFQPFRDHIVIFGSMARNEATAGDIDIMLDYSDRFQSQGLYPEIPDINLFLTLSRQFYGLVDVFVKTQRWLMVRSDDAREWQQAKNSRKIWKAAQTEGVSLNEVLSNWPSS